MCNAIHNGFTTVLQPFRTFCASARISGVICKAVAALAADRMTGNNHTSRGLPCPYAIYRLLFSLTDIFVWTLRNPGFRERSVHSRQISSSSSLMEYYCISSFSRFQRTLQWNAILPVSISSVPAILWRTLEIRRAAIGKVPFRNALSCGKRQCREQCVLFNKDCDEWVWSKFEIVTVRKES